MSWRWRLLAAGGPGGAVEAAVPRGALALAFGTGATGLAVLTMAWERPRPLDVLALALFVGLVVLARTHTLPLFDRSSFAVSVVPVLAAGMVLGVPGAALTALVSGLAHTAVRRLVWYKAVFNCGNYVLAAVLAALVFEAAGVELTPEAMPRLAMVGAAVGLAHYTHTLLVAVALGIEHRTAPHRAWVEHFAWLWPQYAVLGVLAALLALAYRQFGVWGAAAFVVPPAMMLLTAKQYIDRTTQSVRQLRTLNEELRELNAELRSEIRHRELAEAENARLAGEAARAAALQEANELKSRFIAIASHELRTPLTMLTGYTELALDDMPYEDPRHEMLASAHEGAIELAELVENLLDASRIELGRMEIQPTLVDLAGTVDGVLETVRAGAPQHALIASVPLDASWVHADPARLRQILVNLVGNAVKYSPGGGEVRVAARAVGRHVELSVADQGVGIPRSEFDRIFDPYQRASLPTNRQIKGTGLGLYIVRNLVELHGGTVRVESEVGRGSTFYVTLPAADPGPLGLEEPGAGS